MGEKMREVIEKCDSYESALALWRAMSLLQYKPIILNMDDGTFEVQWAEAE